jgi:protein TonB
VIGAASSLAAPPRATTLRVGLVGSAVVHAAALVALWTLRGAPPPALPPVYRVELLGAPAGPAPASVAPATTDVAAEPPAAADVAPRPAPAPAPTPKAVPSKVAAPAAAKALPKAAPARADRRPATREATPAPKRPSPAPTGSAAAPPAATPPGPVAASTGGGTGTDVATVRTEGIAFPFPGYLQNIVRQVAARFRPRNPAAPLKADVAFLIHRDGTVSNVRFVTRSGSYAFDLEAQGAIEAAASAKAFGPLPTGFADDVLPVTFAFDPRVVR